MLHSLTATSGPRLPSPALSPLSAVVPAAPTAPVARAPQGPRFADELRRHAEPSADRDDARRRDRVDTPQAGRGDRRAGSDTHDDGRGGDAPERPEGDDTPEAPQAERPRRPDARADGRKGTPRALVPDEPAATSATSATPTAESRSADAPAAPTTPTEALLNPTAPMPAEVPRPAASLPTAAAGPAGAGHLDGAATPGTAAVAAVPDTATALSGDPAGAGGDAIHAAPGLAKAPAGRPAVDSDNPTISTATGDTSAADAAGRAASATEPGTPGKPAPRPLPIEIDVTSGLTPAAEGPVATDLPRMPAGQATMVPLPTASSHAGAAAHPGSTPHAAMVAESRLAEPPGSAGFAPALGQQVRLWLQDGIQQAQLQLHPAELGPIQIHIELQGKAASIEFHAAMATTREALQAALPQLAGALHEAGYTLAGGGVFDGAGRDRGADAGDGRDPRSGPAAAARAARLGQDGSDVSNRIDLTPRRARSLIDLYA